MGSDRNGASRAPRALETPRFDYVIVGGGSAGCCLAEALSRDAGMRVCLIEAGPSDDSPLVRVPGLLALLLKHPAYNWNFVSAPHAHLADRRVSVPRGRLLGGSGSINSMVYIRGRRSDYDGWAAQGCTGWDWESVLPVFKAQEANARLADDPLHGADGPLYVEDLRSPHRLLHTFVEAGASLQIPANGDFNGVTQEGLGVYQATMHHGRRWSAADAFLRPALRRRNLTVLTEAAVDRIVFDGARASGVVVRGSGGERRIEIDGEVVLTAGAIGSPALLLRSGVGDGAQLGRLGIATLADVPGVGANLHDHPAAMVHMEGGRAGYGLAWSQLVELASTPWRYLMDRTGLLASNMVEGGGFARTSRRRAEPDVQFHFIPGRVGHRGRMVEWGRGFYCDVCVLKPTSRGSLHLASPDPTQAPVIDLQLLSTAEDRSTLRNGLKLLRRLMSAPALAATGATEASPGGGVASDAELDAHIARTVGTAYHPVGTCKMGPAADPLAVVDPRLRVRGLANVRVADASIMPDVVAGNTNAPTMMIAAKAGEMIRADRRSV